MLFCILFYFFEDSKINIAICLCRFEMTSNVVLCLCIGNFNIFALVRLISVCKDFRDRSDTSIVTIIFCVFTLMVLGSREWEVSTNEVVYPLIASTAAGSAFTTVESKLYAATQ